VTYPPPERCLDNTGSGCDCPENEPDGECLTSCVCSCHSCDCACHEDYEYESHPSLLQTAHVGRSCTELHGWLYTDVTVRLQSWQNVTYRHDVSTGLSRAEWLELDDRERDQSVTEAVLRHVEATVLDDPFAS
jgi:hypothetical protein